MADDGIYRVNGRRPPILTWWLSRSLTFLYSVINIRFLFSNSPVTSTAYTTLNIFEPPSLSSHPRQYLKTSSRRQREINRFEEKPSRFRRSYKIQKQYIPKRYSFSRMDFEIRARVRNYFLSCDLLTSLTERSQQKRHDRKWKERLLIQLFALKS